MLLFYRGIGTSLGLDVTTATNGREALDLVEAGETFEAVVTDLNMPVMDGLELTRRLRANFFTSATPVLMATTESEASQRNLALQAGVSGFLNKPLRPEVLAEALGRIL
jgi:CheY-like chemotaxis protein